MARFHYKVFPTLIFSKWLHRKTIFSPLSTWLIDISVPVHKWISKAVFVLQKQTFCKWERSTLCYNVYLPRLTNDFGGERHEASESLQGLGLTPKKAANARSLQNITPAHHDYCSSIRTQGHALSHCFLWHKMLWLLPFCRQRNCG